jgi:hypothetical protein
MLDPSMQHRFDCRICGAKAMICGSLGYHHGSGLQEEQMTEGL